MILVAISYEILPFSRNLEVCNLGQKLSVEAELVIWIGLLIKLSFRLASCTKRPFQSVNNMHLNHATIN